MTENLPRAAGEPAQSYLTRVIEGWYDRFGDTPEGVAWTRPELVATRYDVMLDVIRHDPLPATRPHPASLLDVGCGAGHFYEHLRGSDLAVEYAGLDTSARFIELCRSKYPGVPFSQVDLLATAGDVAGDGAGGGAGDVGCDYAVANGLLTLRVELSHEEMWDYTQRFLVRLFSVARRGIAFNVMSSHVDWERDDLFHVPFDTMAGFVRSQLSRRFAFRQDYGAFEYTTYVYRDPDA